MLTDQAVSRGLIHLLNLSISTSSVSSLDPQETANNLSFARTS